MSYLVAFHSSKQIAWLSPKSLGSGCILFQLSWRYMAVRAGQEPQIVLSSAAMPPFTDEETEAQKRLSN